MKRITLLVVLLLFAATSILAQHGMGQKSKSCCMDSMKHSGMMGKMKSGRMQKGGGIEMLLKLGDEINLTETQRGKLEEMMIDFKLEMVDQKALIEKEQIKLKSLMKNDKSSESDVNDSIDKAAGLRADMQKKRFSHRKSIQNILTDEQKDKLKTLHKDKKERLHEREFKGKEKGHGSGIHGG
jgi:Spy/CpxP family protein refolding chaperone